MEPCVGWGGLIYLLAGFLTLGRWPHPLEVSVSLSVTREDNLCSVAPVRSSENFQEDIISSSDLAFTKCCSRRKLWSIPNTWAKLTPTQKPSGCCVRKELPLCALPVGTLKETYSVGTWVRVDWACLVQSGAHRCSVCACLMLASMGMVGVSPCVWGRGLYSFISIHRRVLRIY